MRATWLLRLGMLCGLAGVLCLTVGPGTAPIGGQTENPAAVKRAAERARLDEQSRVPLAVARDRAKVMHDIYAATLEVIHRRYFHGDKAVVPARAMEDVFSEIKHQSRAEGRWISVNMKAMSIDHLPQSDFELKAAKEIADGKTELEIVEEGYYRRAGAIPLTGGCVGCHGGSFGEPSKSPKFAGLIISLPIIAGERIPD
jgi:hypothetical protein